MVNLFLHRVEETDQDRIRVLGIVFTAHNLQLSSGPDVASGSLFRQVVEGISLGVPMLGTFPRLLGVPPQPRSSRFPGL
jgi:hypothetical protein